MTTPPALWRDRKHDHFWISDGELFESYRTIRGLRWRHRLSVPGMRDEGLVGEATLRFIEERYLKTAADRPSPPPTPGG